MGKKNKGMYDLDASYQEKMMRKLDELLYGSDEVYNDEDDDDYEVDIMSALSKSLDCKSSKNYKAPKQDNNSSARYAYMQNSYDEEIDLGEEEPKESKKPKFIQDIDDANSLRIFFYKDSKIMTFKDTVREVSIDLNLLDCDDEYIDESSDIVDLFSMTLMSTMSNFYPSGIVSNSKLNNTFRNIKSINEGKFIFFNCPYKVGMSLVYYVTDDSWYEFHDAIQEAVDMGCSISLINAINKLMNSDGISFRKVTLDGIHSLITNRDNNKSVNAILGLINSDENTIKSNINNSSFTDVIELNSFIPPEVDDDDIDDDDWEIENEAEVTTKILETDTENGNKRVYPEAVSVEMLSETEVKEVDTIEVDESADEIVFDSKVSETNSEEDTKVEVPPIDDEDDDGEIDLGEDDEPEEMDHDEAEKYYFGNKPAPRESMKSSKQPNNNFVVERRKRH